MAAPRLATHEVQSRRRELPRERRHGVLSSASGGDGGGRRRGGCVSPAGSSSWAALGHGGHGTAGAWRGHSRCTQGGARQATPWAVVAGSYSRCVSSRDHAAPATAGSVNLERPRIALDQAITGPLGAARFCPYQTQTRRIHSKRSSDRQHSCEGQGARPVFKEQNIQLKNRKLPPKHRLQTEDAKTVSPLQPHFQQPSLASASCRSQAWPEAGTHHHLESSLPGGLPDTGSRLLHLGLGLKLLCRADGCSQLQGHVTDTELWVGVGGSTVRPGEELHRPQAGPGPGECWPVSGRFPSSCGFPAPHTGPGPRIPSHPPRPPPSRPFPSPLAGASIRAGFLLSTAP